MILLHLGNIALSKGDLDAAQAYLDESLPLGPRRGDHWIVASAVNNFGEFARYQGDYERAEAFYLESREKLLTSSVTCDTLDLTSETIHL